MVKHIFSILSVILTAYTVGLLPLVVSAQTPAPAIQSTRYESATVFGIKGTNFGSSGTLYVSDGPKVYTPTTRSWSDTAIQFDNTVAEANSQSQRTITPEWYVKICRTDGSCNDYTIIRTKFQVTDQGPDGPYDCAIHIFKNGIELYEGFTIGPGNATAVLNVSGGPVRTATLMYGEEKVDMPGTVNGYKPRYQKDITISENVNDNTPLLFTVAYKNGQVNLCRENPRVTLVLKKNAGTAGAAAVTQAPKKRTVVVSVSDVFTENTSLEQWNDQCTTSNRCHVYNVKNLNTPETNSPLTLSPFNTIEQPKLRIPWTIQSTKICVRYVPLGSNGQPDWTVKNVRCIPVNTSQAPATVAPTTSAGGVYNPLEYYDGTYPGGGNGGQSSAPTCYGVQTCCQSGYTEANGTCSCAVPKPNCSAQNPPVQSEPVQNPGAPVGGNPGSGNPGGQPRATATPRPYTPTSVPVAGDPEVTEAPPPAATQTPVPTAPGGCYGSECSPQSGPTNTPIPPTSPQSACQSYCGQRCCIRTTSGCSTTEGFRDTCAQ